MKVYKGELSPVRVSYSPMERKLFNLLAKGKRLTSTTLMTRYYKNTLAENFHARETINSTLGSLKKKLAFNKEPVALNCSAMCGPHPKVWWLEH